MAAASFFQRARRAWRAFRATSQARGYSGAQIGRLYSDWVAQATSGDTEIRQSFRRLLDRSRDLGRNNDYMRGYLGDCEDNIVGAIKFDLRMDCGEYVFAKGKPPTWQPDKVANNTIETAWAEWGKRGTCTVCGRYSWRDVKRMAVRTVPQDGNFLVRKIRGPAAGNRFNFALQLWEIDHLDLLKFDQLSNGNEIRFGIEYNPMKRPVAYWLRSKHPGDLSGSGYDATTTTRFPASEIYHLFVAERSEQSIGVPWVVSAITRLRQLGAFEEAATVAARLGASNAIFFKKTGDSPGEWSGETTGDGRAIMDVEPGTAQELPTNWDITSHTPAYPNIETGDFRKAMLRGIATSLGTSYTTLGNDLESVNFSSARVGLFDERETWKKHQLFYDDTLNEPVFGDWLEASILAAAINLPLAKFAKFNRPVFKARRWPFIDPVKEIAAAEGAIALRISSRRQVIEEQGGDVEEVFHDNLADENLAKDIGIDLQPAQPITATGTGAGGAALLTEEDTTPAKGKAAKPAAGAAP